MSNTPIVSNSIDTTDSIKLQLRSELEPQIREEFKKKFEVDIALFKDDLRKNNDEMLREAVQKFEEEERKKRIPLSADELQKLLSKEYVTFKVKLQKDNDTIDFILKELPQSVERELYSIAKNSLASASQEFSGFNLRTFEGDVLQKILGMMELFQPLQDILAKCCVLCLDPPRGENKVKKHEWLTEAWVIENLSNYRITTIVLAQVEVNKMRDFFSILFQGFQSDVATTLVNAQQ